MDPIGVRSAIAHVSLVEATGLEELGCAGRLRGGRGARGAGAGDRALSHAGTPRRRPQQRAPGTRAGRGRADRDATGVSVFLPHFCEFFKSSATSTKGLPFTYADRINR
jgi:hypothetical protein